MSHRRHESWLVAFVLVSTAIAVDSGQAANAGAKLAIDHIDMKPTSDGFYDATVGLIMSDPTLGKTGKVAFDVVVGHVHDADEAIDKVHDPIMTFSGDLQAGYKDLHRQP